MRRSAQNLPGQYAGRILNGNYSRQLKRHMARCIRHFQAFDELESPAIPYISAWDEKQNIIWYEFVSRRLTHLLGCDAPAAPEFFQRSVTERHIYSEREINGGHKEEILKNNEVVDRKSELREEVKQKGALEAVYKISTIAGRTLWLKDQAFLESFESDKIHISLGNLTLVTKEMEAEEDLKQAQKALRESEQKFREQAIHDTLTELYNTRYLYTALSALISESASKSEHFSLIFMDIDNFKNVVDTHGHLNASKTLQEIAATIKTALEHPSYGVAYGGDEFVLVLPGYQKHRALDMAEHIRSRINKTRYLQKSGLNIRVSASFGVSTYPDDADTLSGLLALADQAMFNVKERGKDSVCGISSNNRSVQGTTESNFFYDCKR